MDIHKEIIPNLNKNISVRTVRRRLNEFGLRGSAARKKFFISRKNDLARIVFAKEQCPR